MTSSIFRFNSPSQYGSYYLFYSSYYEFLEVIKKESKFRKVLILSPSVPVGIKYPNCTFVRNEEAISRYIRELTLNMSNFLNLRSSTIFVDFIWSHFLKSMEFRFIFLGTLEDFEKVASTSLIRFTSKNPQCEKVYG